MGRGAGGGRVRGVRGSGNFRPRDRGPLRRLHFGARRQLGRDGRVRPLSRSAAGRASAAQTDRHRRVRRLAAAAVLLMAASGGRGATAYVTDELVLNVYTDQDQQGQRLATLHSGASVETLATSADYTQVRLGDGVTGWVKSTFLTANVPATVRVKQLEEELDRSRATTPALAEAAARSEVDRLQQALADKQSELDAALAAHGQPLLARGPTSRVAARSIGAGTAAAAMLAVAALGFWLGYVTLARRIRRKFGGLKVY